jgi:threonine/homoserine/homoserine lactone efflux protein
VTLTASFVRAAGIGLVVAAPVGAMAMRCIERTFARGRAAGYATGAGIASADAVYAAIAALGLTAVTGLLTGAQRWIQLLGGAFLVYLGLRALLSRPRCGNQPEGTTPLLAAFGSAFGLTLANPQTIVMFASVFAGARLVVAGEGWAFPFIAVAGVFGGSMLWWIVLVTVAGGLRERVGDRLLLWVTRTSGVGIAAFGIVAMWAGARG